MLEARRYEDFLKTTRESFKQLPKRLRNLDQLRTSLGETANLQQLTALAQRWEVLLSKAGRNYEALLGAGRRAEAAELAGEILSRVRGGMDVAVLIDHAVRAEDYAAARELVQSALTGLPEDEHGPVQVSAAKIPADG